MSDAASLGRLLRTVRHVRPGQAWAQLRHLVAPGRRVVRLAGAPPLAALSPPAPFPAPGRHASVRAGTAQGEARDAVCVELVNREVCFRDGVDWGHDGEGPLWAYHLHQFDHARASQVPPALRSRLILDWIDAHPSGVGWDPHPTSHRILSWGKLLLTPGALDLDDDAGERVRHSLGSQVATLARHPEIRLQANHLFSNRLAVVFGGLLFEGREADRWLRATDAFLAELRDQVHPDGAHEERSPMYHALLLEQVLDLLNLTRASRRAPDGLQEALVDAASRMCGALELWTLPDGEIALFADSALGIAPPPGVLADYASALAVPVRGPDQPGCLPYGGYARLADERLHLVASVAGPSPDHMPGHAHCDALAFELCVDGERAVFDTGVYEYRPGPAREQARSTASHATLQIDGREQAELWAAHRVGGRPRVAMLEYLRDEACEAVCEAWGSGGVVHRRRFELEGGALVVRDRVEGGPRPVRMTLPLAPEARPRLSGEPAGADGLEVRLAGGARLHVELPAGVAWRLEGMDAFPEFGRRARRFCLVGESEAFDAGTWRFSPDGPRGPDPG